MSTCNQELLDQLTEAEELGLSLPSRVTSPSSSLAFTSPSPSLVFSDSSSPLPLNSQPHPRGAFSSKPSSADTRPPILAPTTALSITSSPVFVAAFDKIIRRGPGRIRAWPGEFALVGKIYAIFQHFKTAGTRTKTTPVAWSGVPGYDTREQTQNPGVAVQLKFLLVDHPPNTL
jgi:hypothetical protein